MFGVMVSANCLHACEGESAAVVQPGDCRELGRARQRQRVGGRVLEQREEELKDVCGCEGILGALHHGN